MYQLEILHEGLYLRYNKNSQNQGLMTHLSRSTDFRLWLILQRASVVDWLKAQTHKHWISHFVVEAHCCSNLKFCMRIYIYNYNKNLQESGHDDLYNLFY